MQDQHCLLFDEPSTARFGSPLVILKLDRAVPSALYSTYWYFAAERQRVYNQRIRGAAGPWTNDPVLRTYRFTNAYRASDRVSQYLIQHVIYEGDQSAEEIVFRILLFKFFNKISTWQTLVRELGELTWKGFDTKRYGDVLSSAMAQGERIFSSAYIMPSRAPGFRNVRKHENFLGILDFMMRDRITSKLAMAKSLAEVFERLRAYPLLGDFLAFQFAIDVNYSEVIDFSEMDFVVAGPGAKSGLRKCFTSPGGHTESELIRIVADRQLEEFARHGEDFEDLGGRPLQLIDCQNLFCETDKYARVAHPEIEGIGNRTRIKRSFIQQPGALEQWFPPKWGINCRIRWRSQ